MKSQIVVRCHTPAFPTSQLKHRALISDMLILETNFVRFWGLTTRTAQLNLTLIDPPLVSWSLLDIFGGLHLMVQIQLLHEPIVWLADRSCLP